MTSSPPTHEDRRLDYLVKLVASLFLAGCFIWILQRGGLPLIPDANARQHMVWVYLPAQLLLLAASTFLRTHRWKYLLEPLDQIPLRKVLGVGFIGFGYIAFAPFRMGELARPYMISRDTRVSFLQATGTVAAERIIDGLFITIILLIGLLTSTPLAQLPDHLGKLALPVSAVPKFAYSALALFTCAFIAMGLFYWARDFARRLTQAVVGLVSKKLADFLTDKVERTAEGLSFLPSTRSSIPFFRETILYWGLNVVYTWLSFRSCGLEATPSQAAVILGVMALGILVPSGPGFFGGYQLSAYCGLAMFFTEDIVLSKGSLYVFLSYTTQHSFNLLGLLFGLWLARSSASKPADPEAPKG